MTDNKNVSDLGVSLTAGYQIEPIEEGVHDYSLSGVAIIGLVQSDMLNDKGHLSAPSTRARFMFELPDELMKDKEGNESTRMVSVDLTLSVSERGNYRNLVGNLLKKHMTEGEMAEYVTSAGLKSLLGKTGQLTIVHYKKKDGNLGYKVDPKAFVPRRSNAKPPTPATKETLFFNPYNPDIEVFKKLNNWTQKSIMEAVNANQFSTELHEAWKEIQENKAQESGGQQARGDGGGSAPSVNAEGNTMSIE